MMSAVACPRCFGAQSGTLDRSTETSGGAAPRVLLIEDERSIEVPWLDGTTVVGVSSGASTPDVLVERVVSWLQGRGYALVEELPVATEDVHFPLPAGLD